jgi:hypothetical protein
VTHFSASDIPVEFIDAVLEAKRQGFGTFCVKCQQGFNGEVCQKCDVTSTIWDTLERLWSGSPAGLGGYTLGNIARSIAYDLKQAGKL